MISLRSLLKELVRINRSKDQDELKEIEGMISDLELLSEKILF
jgi:hypothetical protein